MVEVEGADQLRALALELRAAGQVELLREMRFAMEAAAQPAERAIRQSAEDQLPHGGGLNQFIASSNFRTSVLTGVRTAGVQLRVSKPGGAKGKHDLTAFDNGQFRHPVFADSAKQTRGQWKWVPQYVAPGFASKPVEALVPLITVACLEAMDEVAIAAGFTK